MRNPADTLIESKQAAENAGHVDTAAGYTKNPFSGQLNNFAVEPKSYVQEHRRIGFTSYAELVNGRAAMIGFASLVIIELLAGQPFVSLITSI